MSDDALEARCEPSLPPVLRIFCVSPETPEVAALTRQLNHLGCLSPRILWAANSEQTLRALRQHPVDLLLVDALGQGPETLVREFMPLLSAARSAGFSEAMLVLADTFSDEAGALALAANADLLLTTAGWESHILGGFLARAWRRHEQLRAARRSESLAEHRLARDRDEAEELLDQQRRLLETLASASLGSGAATLKSISEDAESALRRRRDASERHEFEAWEPQIDLPASVASVYDDLLRTCVLSGGASVAAETRALAELLGEENLSPHDLVRLHLSRLEPLLRGLGDRGARHVVARADLLAMELLTQLGEHYRARLMAE